MSLDLELEFTMANKKIKLDPSKWIVDDNNFIHFRYRIVTDDLNIKSATSSVFSIEAPSNIFDSIVSNISSETIGETTIIRVNWTTKPQYNGMQYFVFVQTPADDSPIYNKTISETTFSYVVDNNDPEAEGTYTIVITLPSTTKAITALNTLVTKTVTL